ncbi:hypothetical protein D910_04677 [Dendroctonus ponderosae]|uniref:Macro domain-containing protein n=1 Tax=Dendroctonus ponderosae TaxID=77166 RepID=J3JVS4_DENPD|nr:unknown [Dendroctonus ponderosae]ERL87281.1 hypothetical protein D910_04677 [Dendroctonus ponderosae]
MEPEPLGKLPEPVVLVETLNRWGDAPSAQHASVIIPSGEVRGLHASPFPCDDCINQKLILWDGDISSLEVDAIVNSTNESMNDINPASASIFRRAGPRLREEIKADVKECGTGEAKVTQGHYLPARYIIHTVGPKYNMKYQTASENTLHMCYRNTLQKAKEMGLHSIAIPVINSLKRNYPPDQGAHVALRVQANCIIRKCYKFWKMLSQLLTHFRANSANRCLTDVCNIATYPRNY